MENFKRINRITGWIVFLVAATVYLLTIEPTASFWDCGEFIASAYKLLVGHPPGAPFFMLLGRFFTMFAPDTSSVAAMMNSMSALASAFTILFLYWTIVHLAIKIYPVEKDKSHIWAVIGSGIVGAMAFTFSDTFWFSAVEGEVYALSSLFTAFVFYAILKWENIADKEHSNRWIILIAFLMGVSIGVHLLNLLAIPAIVFVYYFKKYKVTRKGIIGASLLSILLLATFMWVIIPGLVRLAGAFELLFVNGLGLPFESGTAFYLLLLAGLISWGLYYTHKHTKPILNTILLVFTVIVIGYSSYAMIIIRSSADPPMDENDPETIFALYNYLKREQYGQHPLFFGQYYNAPVVDIEEPHTYVKKDGKYKKSYSLNPHYEFDSRFTTFFPRMYSRQQNHVREYKKWADIEGRKVTVNQGGEQQVKNVPTFGENLKFFFKYQVGHMYLRYFMWNFAGRQNDIQGHGEVLHGNWLSGIKFLDEMRLGTQEGLPSKFKNNPGRNTYYMLPLLLGLIGFFFHYKKKPKDFTVILLLFILTGIAIVVYLNQPPLQPRERDYAYAGSFYAFAIWIGLGVLSLYELVRKKAPNIVSAISVTLASLLLVPGIMAKENWDDHDRSNRYVARDFAYNYLNTCAPNAIIFTHGDNDTFPLWYAQEVEGIRTDVRVVNLSLLNTDWYIDQMKRKAYESEPVPFSLEKEQYKQGTRDDIPIQERIKDYVDVKQVIDFIGSDNSQTKLSAYGDQKVDYMPTKQLKVKVDSAKVVNNGTVKEEDADEIVDEIRWKINKSRLTKSEMMIIDLLAHNNWERPIYFVSPSQEGNLGLQDYLQEEGFAYRLIPVKTEAENQITAGKVAVDSMYDNLMDKFKWGNINKEDVYVDYTTRRTTQVVRVRNKFARLAGALNEKGENNKAIEVLDRAVELFPHSKIPYDIWVVDLVEEYYKAGANDKAEELAEELAKYMEEEINYYSNLQEPFASSVENDKRMALHIIHRLSQITNNHGTGELSKKYENIINNVMEEMQGSGGIR